MPGAQIRFLPNGQSGFLHPLVQLKKMRMTRADTNPNNFCRAFWRKCSNTLDWQKESAKLNCPKFFTQRKIDIVPHVREKAESEMHLIAFSPAHASDVRVKIDKVVSDVFGQIDCYEKPLWFHQIAEPARASSPLAPIAAGNRLFTIFMMRAAKFGKSALAITSIRAGNGMTKAD